MGTLSPFTDARGRNVPCHPCCLCLCWNPWPQKAEPQHIREFIRALGEDRVSLYVDDTFFRFGGDTSSLQNLMSLMEHFDTLSGFSINWSKLVLLPLDSITHPLPECAQFIQIAISYKYLGVHVTADPCFYVDLNLLPLLQQFKAKCSTWCKLPLSVVGRVNLIKMVWAAKMLYIFHSSPTWIPHR